MVRLYHCGWPVMWVWWVLCHTTGRDDHLRMLLSVPLLTARMPLVAPRPSQGPRSGTPCWLVPLPPWAPKNCRSVDLQTVSDNFGRPNTPRLLHRCSYTCTTPMSCNTTQDDYSCSYTTEQDHNSAADRALHDIQYRYFIRARAHTNLQLHRPSAGRTT